MCGALPHCLRTGEKHHARRRHALRSPERPNQHGFARDAQRRRTRAGFAAPRACLAARNNATQSHKRLFLAQLATIARNTADASALCGSSLCVRAGSLLSVVQWSASRVGNKVAYPTVVPYPSRPVSHPRPIYNRIGQKIFCPASFPPLSAVFRRPQRIRRPVLSVLRGCGARVALGWVVCACR